MNVAQTITNAHENSKYNGVYELTGTRGSDVVAWIARVLREKEGYYDEEE